MLTVSADDLQQTFGFRAPRGYQPRYNIPPSQPLLALTGEGGRELREIVWGLVPASSPDSSASRRHINARAESVWTKAAFKEPFESRRCLVVIDGYYEWQADGGVRRPHRVCLESRRPFTVAGLWDRWGEDDQEIDSCAIITTSASPRIVGIHDRMPLMIPEGERDAWLDPGSSLERLREIMVPYDGDDLEAYEVSPLVNSPANDTPACVEPFHAPAQDPSSRPLGRSRRKAVSSEVLDLFPTQEGDS